jgi:hypothetical protein
MSRENRNEKRNFRAEFEGGNAVPRERFSGECVAFKKLGEEKANLQFNRVLEEKLRIRRGHLDGSIKQK